jgi:hypothetical protein
VWPEVGSRGRRRRIAAGAGAAGVAETALGPGRSNLVELTGARLGFRAKFVGHVAGRIGDDVDGVRARPPGLNERPRKSRC